MNLYGINGFPSLLRVMLDLVSDPSLICEVGFAIMMFLHAKCATKLA